MGQETDLVILTPQELASRLKVPVSWVYEKTRRRCDNPLPCMKLGRYIRFDWRKVVVWLESTQTTGGRSRS